MTYSVTENTLRDESPIPCDDQTNFTFDSCFNDAIYKVCNKLFCVLSKDNTHSQNLDNLMPTNAILVIQITLKGFLEGFLVRLTSSYVKSF